MDEKVKVEIEGSFAWIWLIDPKGINAMGTQFMGQLEAVIDALEKRADLKGAVFATNANHFSVGLDFKEVAKGSSAEVLKIAQKGTTNFNRISRLPYPTLALLRGHSVGGAIELSAGCDFRIAAEDTKISVPAPKIGFFNPTATCYRLARLLGLGRAKDLMLSSKTIDAMTAKEWGFVSEVVKADQLIEAGKAWVRSIDQMDAMASKCTKQLLDMSYESSLEDYMKVESKLLIQCLDRTEPFDRIKNFLQK